MLEDGASDYQFETGLMEQGEDAPKNIHKGREREANKKRVQYNFSDASFTYPRAAIGELLSFSFQFVFVPFSCLLYCNNKKIKIKYWVLFLSP